MSADQDIAARRAWADACDVAAAKAEAKGRRDDAARERSLAAKLRAEADWREGKSKRSDPVRFDLHRTNRSFTGDREIQARRERLRAAREAVAEMEENEQ